jgi:hypothetical protein
MARKFPALPFDAQGDISDSATRDNVRKFVEGFVSYVRARKPPGR